MAFLDVTFSNAKRVLVWLGLQTDESDRLYDYMDTHFPRPYQVWDDHICEDLAKRSREMISLLNRPYWSRTWVQQECVLGREPYFYCGNRWVDNDSLQQACNHLVESLNNYEMVRCSSEHPRSANLDFSNDELVDSALSAILDCRFVKIRHFREDLESSPRDLFNIIMNHQYTECSDPRDKVYSLQRLCYPPTLATELCHGITASLLSSFSAEL